MQLPALLCIVKHKKMEQMASSAPTPYDKVSQSVILSLSLAPKEIIFTGIPSLLSNKLFTDWLNSLLPTGVYFKSYKAEI